MSWYLTTVLNFEEQLYCPVFTFEVQQTWLYDRSLELSARFGCCLDFWRTSVLSFWLISSLLTLWLVFWLLKSNCQHVLAAGLTFWLHFWHWNNSSFYFIAAAISFELQLSGCCPDHWRVAVLNFRLMSSLLKSSCLDIWAIVWLSSCCLIVGFLTFDNQQSWHFDCCLELWRAAVFNFLQLPWLVHCFLYFWRVFVLSLRRSCLKYFVAVLTSE